MFKASVLSPNLRSVEILGKFADQLKRRWMPFPSLRLAVPEFHRRVQEVYEHVEQLILKVEYLESPTPEDFRFIRDLIMSVRESIQLKYLLDECIQKKVARKTPREYIKRTKYAVRLMQKILKETKNILKNCYEITLKLLSTPR